MIRRLKKWFSFETHEIMSRDETRHYLTRQYLLGHRRSAWALMLHTMHIPDDDSCHHDHPWNFLTLILSGGYWEEVTDGCPCGDEKCGNNRHGHNLMRRRWNGPGRVRFNSAEHTHRIDDLPTGSCRTLVLRFRKKRSWGFQTREGWVYWKDFLDLRKIKAALWCGDE